MAYSNAAQPFHPAGWCWFVGGLDPASRLDLEHKIGAVGARPGPLGVGVAQSQPVHARGRGMAWF